MNKKSKTYESHFLNLNNEGLLVSSKSVGENNSSFKLTGHFLIAMPSMLDPIFGGTVVYVCEHHIGGALGVIINRPTDMTIDLLFERIDLSLGITVSNSRMQATPVMFGGPVQMERGFVLHAPSDQYSSSLDVSDGIALTTSRDVLDAVSQGKGP